VTLKVVFPGWDN